MQHERDYRLLYFLPPARSYFEAVELLIVGELANLFDRITGVLVSMRQSNSSDH